MFFHRWYTISLAVLSLLMYVFKNMCIFHVLDQKYINLILANHIIILMVSMLLDETQCFKKAQCCLSLCVSQIYYSRNTCCVITSSVTTIYLKTMVVSKLFDFLFHNLYLLPDTCFTVRVSSVYLIFIWNLRQFKMWNLY